MNTLNWPDRLLAASANRSRRRRSRRRERSRRLPRSTSRAVLEPREPPEHEPGREADLGDDHDEPEEQRAVPLPPVQRDDHVERGRSSSVPMPASQAMIFMSISSLLEMTLARSRRRRARSRLRAARRSRPRSRRRSRRPASRARIARCDSTEPVSATMPLSRGEQRREPGRERRRDEHRPGGGFSAS